MTFIFVWFGVHTSIPKLLFLPLEIFHRCKMYLQREIFIRLFSLFSLSQMFFHTRENVYQHARHMGTLTSSGINPMWNEWKTKFIAALDEVAPQVAVRKKKKGQALSLDDTGAFAPTAPAKITFQKN